MIDSYLQRVTSDTAALADAVRAAPTAPISCYDGWTLVELARHVGQIHRWVTGVVATRATERPAGVEVGDVEVHELPAWLTDGAARLVDTLAAAGPDERVWTFSRSHHDIAFWRRRMALETALHRWDAEDAVGLDAAVPEPLALEGVEETLRVYLEQRLDGRDVGGTGQRVAFVPRGADGWTVHLHADAVEVAGGRGGADATVTGSALDLWLLLTCRRGLDGLAVTGDREAADLAVHAATLVPGPAD